MPLDSNDPRRCVSARAGSTGFGTLHIGVIANEPFVLSCLCSESLPELRPHLIDMTEIPETASDFRRSLRQLRSRREKAADNPGSHGVEASTRCHDCMFTVDSEDCVQCTDCESCRQCIKCTHCVRCENCYASNHCIDSTRCADSSHLIACEQCVDCEFCVGCVGLVDAEFHILNESFTREEYFDRLDTLEDVLDLETP